MDDTEEEKVQLLESLRLQDAALSTTVDESIVALNSDSDSEDDKSKSPNNTQIQTDHSKFSEPAEPEENESDSVEEISSDPSWADALEANQEYDAVLAQLEAEIKMNLAKVSTQLDELHSKLTAVNAERATMNLKSHWIYIFGMPYFKTHDLYPCPYNKDYHLKKTNNEICWTDLPVYHQWIPQYKKILNYAVKKLSTEKCEIEAQFKLAALRKDADFAKQAGNIERATELELEIEAFDVSDFVSKSVDAVIASGDHDWLQISAKYLEGKQSPESCRSFWNLYLQPKINKAPYTPGEEAKLLSLAEKYKQQNWDLIAEQLGTNRSGYQCFIVFQNKLNENIKRSMWEPEEDQRLQNLVEKFRIGDYIPWAKVTYHLEGRTKSQVFNRWSYSIKPTIKKGRFTQEEDIMILVGVQMWGENFQRISQFLSDRTTSQIRDRYKHYLNRPDLGIPWTVNDDERLLKLVAENGRNWKKICKHFPSKDRTQVRHRHTSLLKFRAKYPNAPLTDAPSRCYNPQMYKDFQEQWDRAKKILNCNTIDEMVKAKNNLVSSLLKRKKRAIPKQSQKKKPSIIEADLINYFRCSYDIPGACRKLQLKSGEVHKYADELEMIVSVLKAKLNLPSFDELDEDPTLSTSDKEILKAYISRGTDFFKDSPAHSPEEVIPEPTTESQSEKVIGTVPLPLFSDLNKPSSSSSSDSSDCNIDYIPSHDFASRYIDLPLMNYELDAVVADRNKDPSFYEIPTFDYIVPDAASSPPKKEEFVMFPPNLTSIVALRTFLLNRRTLVDWANANSGQVVEVNDEKLAEAQRKFDERIWCLFLWPALMSRYAPSSNDAIFLDEETTSVKSDSFMTGLKRPSPGGKIISALAATGQLIPEDAPIQNIDMPSTSGISLTKSSKRKQTNSETVEKRRKIVLKEEDEDPDDPDEVMDID
ncbi:snRNA-activating protein complex subunit 4 [Thrips palmi]|uniref:snRNA-activating protein complex subunit 4 n=1 Tax=Thrips palmi TaxID=161013 RepID=A0A6P8XTH2_THRPL|nr:snRNA-activating protein complex subunit 4 [Thrips palmi]